MGADKAREKGVRAGVGEVSGQVCENSCVRGEGVGTGGEARHTASRNRSSHCGKLNSGEGALRSVPWCFCSYCCPYGEGSKHPQQYKAAFTLQYVYAV